MSDESERLRKIQKKYGNYVYFWSGHISDESFIKLTQEVARFLGEEKPSVAYLVLTTYGGDAAAAYKSIRLLHEIFNKVVVIVTSVCKSAGTLMVLGATEIQMAVTAELGPLDVQIREQDELFSTKSGLTSDSAFHSLSEKSYQLFEKLMLSIKNKSGNSISFKLSAEIASQITCDLMKPIYEQLNPQIIGSDYRKLHTATQYGKRLAGISKNVEIGAIERLVSGYHDHGFVIDYKEASDLFNSVSHADNIFFSLPDKLKYLTIMPTNRTAATIKGLGSLLEEHPEDDNKQSKSAESKSKSAPKKTKSAPKKQNKTKKL